MRYIFFGMAVVAAGCVEVHTAIFHCLFTSDYFRLCVLYNVHCTSAIGAIAENCNNWMNVCWRHAVYSFTVWLLLHSAFIFMPIYCDAPVVTDEGFNIYIYIHCLSRLVKGAMRTRNDNPCGLIICRNIKLE